MTDALTAGVGHARVVQATGASGLRLGLENRYHFFDLPSPDEMEELLSLASPDRLGFVYDVGHAQALDRLGFYDGSYLHRCGAPGAAFRTSPGYALIYVCPARFRQLSTTPNEARATIIHEVWQRRGLRGGEETAYRRRPSQLAHSPLSLCSAMTFSSIGSFSRSADDPGKSFGMSVSRTPVSPSIPVAMSLRAIRMYSSCTIRL